MSLKPRGIREHLAAQSSRSMRAPPPTAISAATPDADGGFSWEKTDLADVAQGAF